MAYVNFSNLDGQSFQAPNPGGYRKVLIILSRMIQGNWPNKASIANGEITALPMLRGTNKFAEYTFPDGSASADFDGNGDPSFQSFKHGMELMTAGFSKMLVSEIQKHLNAGSVVIMEMNDSQYVVVGSSDNPVFLKPSFKGGKKGSDKRGTTFKGEVDGMMWPLLPIAETLVAQLPVQEITE